MIIDRLLKNDIIEESDSAWSSPVVLVKRLTDIDFVQICKKLIPLQNYLLSPTSTRRWFSNVAENNATLFSFCDFTTGYLQVCLDDASKPKTHHNTSPKLPIYPHSYMLWPTRGASNISGTTAINLSLIHI